MTSPTEVTVDAKRMLALAKREAQETLTVIEEFEAHDKASEAEGINLLSSIKRLQKGLKAKKEKVIKPLNEALSAVRDLFRPVETDLRSAEDALKETLNLFHAQEVAAAKEAQKKLEARLEAGRIKPQTFERKSEALEKPKISSVTDEGNRVQYRKVREIEIVDESKIPEEFWVLDLVTLRRRALGGETIPGVNVVENTVPVVQ